MKSEFQKYLKDLGATKPIQDRVEYFYCLCRNMAYGQLLDIFVDEYLTADKSRKYLGLSFYSKYFTFSIPNFLTESSFSILPHQMAQDSIGISVSNYDFKKTNEESLLSVKLFYKYKSVGGYKASQNNCAYLLRILRKYIQPSLRGRDILV